MEREGELLEWAEVFHGHRYGTPAGPVELHRSAGRDVLLEIDVEGARQVREQVPDAVLILLEPPSRAELERRLRSRGTESEADIAERLATADRELAQRDRFDHVVVNDDVEAASSQVAAIIEASRTRPGPSDRPTEDPSA
jgi:guanylate kinase